MRLGGQAKRTLGSSASGSQRPSAPTLPGDRVRSRRVGGARVREGHAHLGALAGRALELERVRERGDQRQAEAERGRLGAGGAGLDAGAVVAHDDREAVLVGEHLDLEHAGVLVVGVDDDVGARLGDRHLHVGEDGGVEVERVGHAGERLADDADALRPGRHGQQDLRRRAGHSPEPLVVRAAAIASSRPWSTGRTGTRPVMSRIRWTPGSTLSPTQTT